jgi:tetratricopeptide (TPR) repeat protein
MNRSRYELPARTTKPSIAGLMWVVLLTAIGLAVGLAGTRRGQNPGPLLLYVFVGGIGLTVFLQVWFLVLPKNLARLSGGDRERDRRWLERIVALPLGGEVMKVLARFMLGIEYQVAHRHAKAEAQFRRILSRAGTGLLPAFEALVRQRLADCVESLGRSEDAAEERRLAAVALYDGKDTFLAHQAHGKLHERDHRYAEAYRSYERGLALVPEKQKAIRVEFMVHLTLTAFNLGRSANSLRWAEAALELEPAEPYAGMARRMAAIGCNNIGRLADAERYARLAAEFATKPDAKAQSLALAADYVMRRGDLVEAEHLAHEAEAIHPGKMRLPCIVLAAIAKLRGDTDTAIAATERAIPREKSFIPALNRRIQAVYAKEMAALHAEAGRGDIALVQLRAAEPELAGDPKLRVSLDAAAALVHAVRGERTEALARIARSDANRGTIPEDRVTQRAALYLLGKAALVLNDPARAESHFHTYLELEPNPVFLPYVHYHLAECRRRLGDLDGGQAHDRQAAAFHFGTLHERLARERLAAEGAG